MATVLGLLTIGDLRGGRNNTDPSIALAEDQVVEALNVDWYSGLLGRRRPGAVNVPLAGPGVSLTMPLPRLIRHLPTAKETESEFWVADNAAPCNAARQPSGGAWSAVALADATAATTAPTIDAASFNGKLFLAYNSGVDRLHVWDGTSVRRVGLVTPGVGPTVTALAGSGITGQRWYRIAWTVLSGAAVIRRSELSPATTLVITNQGGWTITRPAPPGEGETSWEIYAGNTANGPWYLMTQVAIATPSLNDAWPPATFPNPGWPNTLAPAANANTMIPSVKYIMVDEARLIMAGSFLATGTLSFRTSRVWWTPILNDASGVGNDERLNFTINPFIDFDPGDGGEITGLGGPLADSPYVFKYDRVYKMVRTGLAGAAYRPVTISKKCGAIRNDTIVLGEDEAGGECLYFLSRRGPYRVGTNGLQYCGRDIEDLWSRVNLNAASGDSGAHGVYHSDLHQVWWWVPLDGSATCNAKIVFDVKQGRFDATTGVRRGWSLHDGESTKAAASVMYARVNAAPLSLALAPYIGYLGGGGAGSAGIWRCDVTSVGSNDNGTPYRALIRTRIILPGQSIATHGGTIEGFLIGSPTSAPIRVTTIRDYGLETRNSDVTLTPQAAETRVIVPLRDLAATDCATLQLEFGDPAAAMTDWILDQLVLRIRREEDR